MKMDRRTFIKKMNWALASGISMLGFASCEKESGANYTVKGAVVNKEGGKPIAGIQVGYIGRGYSCVNCVQPMYGTIPTPYEPKTHVMTNAKGEFTLTDRFHDEEFQMIDNNRTLPVYVQDVANGLFQSEFLQVDFPKGKHIVTVNVELTEIKDQ